MDSGTNKSLFTLIAVVVFGIFLSLSYFMFQDQLKGVLADVLTKTSMKTNQTLIDQLAATPEVFFNVVNNGDGTCKITSYDVAGGKVLVIPSEINGLIVTTISNTAFQNKGLTSVTLPSTLTKIEDGTYGGFTDFMTNKNGSGAFAHNSLKTLTLPEGLTYIGNSAFANCGLTSVTIPNSVTYMGTAAFGKNNLISVDLPYNLTSLKWDVFINNRLSNITIPESVTSIKRAALGGNLLTTVTLPENIIIANPATSYDLVIFVNNPLVTVNIPLSQKTAIQANNHILELTQGASNLPSNIVYY